MLLIFPVVDSCFYVWMDKAFAGYSQVSQWPTSEFDVTEYLSDGENEMYVLVLKWCDGTYCEDQDKLRMSGIFRDVYLLRRPKDHIPGSHDSHIEFEEAVGKICVRTERKRHLHGKGDLKGQGQGDRGTGRGIHLFYGRTASFVECGGAVSLYAGTGNRAGKNRAENRNPDGRNR